MEGWEWVGTASFALRFFFFFFNYELSPYLEQSSAKNKILLFSLNIQVMSGNSTMLDKSLKLSASLKSQNGNV